jgi:hypothetical protein
VFLVSALDIFPRGCLDTEVNIQYDIDAGSQIQDAVCSDNFEATDVDVMPGAFIRMH